jgi:putative radical SAM enzyme (TIGR03279 family)
MLTIKPALVTRVEADSIAAEIGFTPGDRLVKINGTIPRDLIDYRFLCADEFLELEVIDSDNKTHIVEIEKDCDEDLGLEFDTALFDGLMQCTNHCPFCFIDQQPPGKRASLYYKDDDYRLSFLYGSYLTLTNITDKEWERIANLRLSPLYVSVHATEPAVRERLLKNPRAGAILDRLKWFRKNRLQIHAQVVVCPGINDGVHLEKTIRDLAAFQTTEIPTVASIAIVPVGLTKFRPAEDELIPVSRQCAAETIAIVENMQAELRRQRGSHSVWLADEWYLIAGRDLPPSASYEDYPQIGNGVGSIRQFIDEFQTAVDRRDLEGMVVSPPQTCTWVVGNAVERVLLPIVNQLNAIDGLQVNFKAIASEYWGQSISVTGVIVGSDLLNALMGEDCGEYPHPRH